VGGGVLPRESGKDQQNREYAYSFKKKNIELPEKESDWGEDHEQTTNPRFSGAGEVMDIKIKS